MNVMLGKLFDESLWAHLFPGLMIYSISSARSSFWRVSKTDSDRQRDWYSLTAAATKPEEPVERAIERASGDDCVCVFHEAAKRANKASGNHVARTLIKHINLARLN